MKPDEAVVTPAPTREVVGDLLVAFLDLLVEQRACLATDVGLRAAILEAMANDKGAAAETLELLRADDAVRRERLDSLLEDAKSLVARFAGATNA